MKVFSLHRFNLTLRYQLAADWKRQVGFTAIITIVIFMMLWFLNWTNTSLIGNVADDQMVMMKGLFGFLKIVMALSILGLAIGYNSAHSMPFMKSKTAHIAHLVLPATTAEKYAVVQTRAFLLSIVETLFALLVAELLQYAITGNFSIGDYAAVDWDYLYQTGNFAKGTGTLLTTAIWVAVVTTLLYSAWFTFCATVFRKHPFLFGILIMWGLQQVFSIVSFSLSECMLDFATWISGQFSGMKDVEIISQLTTMLDWTIVLIVFLAIIFWVLSYHRLKRAEIR